MTRFQPPRAAVIVLAAGAGRRVGAETNKVLLPLAGLPVFAWSLRSVMELENVDHVVVVIREQDRNVVERTLSSQSRDRLADRSRDHLPESDITVVVGGSTRHASEWNALNVLAGPVDAGVIDVVVIHDAARPLAGADLFAAVIDAAAAHGGALPVRAQPALVTRRLTPPGAHDVTSPGGARDLTSPGGAHDRLVGVQTPQAFQAVPLLDAYRQAARDRFVGTDTASCVERYTSLEIHCVPCAATNLKITYPEDVVLAGRLLEKLNPA